jgi:tetratricopeptide (TPR) repeat protein
MSRSRVGSYDMCHLTFPCGFPSGLASFLCVLLTFISGCRTPEGLLRDEAEKLLVGGAYREACEEFTRYIELSPKDPEGYFYRGVAAWGLGEFDAAESDIARAILLSPANRDFRWTTYRILRDRCEKLQSKAVPPLERPIRETLLLALHTLMRKDLEMLLRLDPHDVSSRFELALVLKKLGLFEEAISELNICIMNMPFDPEFRNERGSLLHEVGKFEDAIEDYDVAIEYGEGPMPAEFNRALSLEKLGRREEAALALQDVVLRDSQDGEAWCLLGKLQHSLGRNAAGCSSLQTSRSLGNAEARDLFEELCR